MKSNCMQKTTEQTSNYRHLEKMSTAELLQNMNNEDKTVPHAIEKVLPVIEKLVDEIISYVAPTFLGSSARAMFNAEFSVMAEQLRFKLKHVAQFGQDVRLSLIPESV